MPLQFGSCRIFEASISTGKINKSGFNGHFWRTPLESLK